MQNIYIFTGLHACMCIGRSILGKEHDRKTGKVSCHCKVSSSQNTSWSKQDTVDNIQCDTTVLKVRMK
jgi:hypothetical protein